MECASAFEKLNESMRAALETQLEVWLIRAAQRHGTINRLPGDRDLWDDADKKPTHCLWHPRGEAGYAVPITGMKALTHMDLDEMLAFLQERYPVIVPKQSKNA